MIASAQVTRHFSLRGLMCFMAVIGFSCGLAAAGDTSTLRGILFIAIAARVLAAVLVGAIVGLLVGSVSSALLSAVIGVMVADLAWIGFGMGAFSIDSSDAVNIAANPILALTLIVCPAAAARSRRRALVIGISFSLIVPIIVAIPILLSCIRSGAPGTGLAEAVTIIVATIAMVAGILGTLGARAIVEFGRYVASRTRSVPGRVPGAAHQGARSETTHGP